MNSMAKHSYRMLLSGPTWLAKLVLLLSLPSTWGEPGDGLFPAVLPDVFPADGINSLELVVGTLPVPKLNCVGSAWVSLPVWPPPLASTEE